MTNAKLSSRFKEILISAGPFIGLLVVFSAFAIYSKVHAGGEFYQWFNIKTIITQMVIVGVAALGMTLIIIRGGIDLSVGSQVALGTVVTATIMMKLGGADVESQGLSTSLVAALGGIAACAICGLVIGVISTKLKIVPFIVTLGMMQIARGSAKWLSNEAPIYPPENSLNSLMDISSGFIFPNGVWILLILTVLMIIVLRYTVFGRQVFALGSNEQTAKLCGINVEFKTILIYTLGGVFAGIASIMQFSQLSGGDPTVASGMELDVIAAVVIGGGSLSGGVGSATGTIIGALIMAVLRNGCNMIGVPTFAQEIIIGVIIVGAVAIDMLKHRFSD